MFGVQLKEVREPRSKGASTISVLEPKKTFILVPDMIVQNLVKVDTKVLELLNTFDDVPPSTRDRKVGKFVHRFTRAIVHALDDLTP